MVMGVDDVLIACAEAAASALGKELATEIFNAVFGNLATKQDIAKAVTAIEAYIKEQMQDLENDLLCVNATTAISELMDYTKDGDTQQLGFAYDHFTQARSWLDQQRAALGDDFLRTQYVAVVQYITGDLALWINYALCVDRAKYANTTCGKIDDHLAILNQAVAQVQKMETESATSIQTGRHIEKSGGGPDDPPELNPYVEASYTLYKGTYPNGSVAHTTGWINSDQVADAVNRITPEYNADVARISAENQQRSNLVYSPASRFATAMTTIKTRLQGP